MLSVELRLFLIYRKSAAYAMVNHKEFFAELSVAYLCNTYEECEKCSPPLAAWSVLDRKLVSRDRIHPYLLQPEKPRTLWPCFAQKKFVALEPCGKFFPFTRSQFEAHDPTTYNFLKNIWEGQIGIWKVPVRKSCRTCCFP